MSRKVYLVTSGDYDFCVWAGPRFATVELEYGYRESFGYEELRRAGKAS